MSMLPPDNSSSSLKYLRQDLSYQDKETQEYSQREDLRDYTPLLFPREETVAPAVRGNTVNTSQKRWWTRKSKLNQLKESRHDLSASGSSGIGSVKKGKTGSKAFLLRFTVLLGDRIMWFLSWLRPFNTLRLLGLPIIARYIVAEFLFSFLISFSFFFFIFLVNALLLVARKYAGEGLPLWAILQLIYYNIPTNVSLSLPFSVLVGALMAVGHLGSSNQMLAFRACSVRKASVLAPLLFCSILVAVGSFIFSDYFLPLGRINTQKIILHLLSNNPKVIINPYSVRSFRSNNGRNTYIISGPVEDEMISDLFIVDYDQDVNRRIFFAKTAYLADKRPTGVVPFILDDVNTTIASNRQPQTFSYMTAASLLYNVLLGDVTETYELGPDDRQVWEIIRTLRETQSEQKEPQIRYRARTVEYLMHYRSVYKSFYLTTDATQNKSRVKTAYDNVVNRSRSYRDDKLFVYRMALYLRLSTPFSCIPFMLLAFSLGSMAKRHGRSIGFLLGLVLSGVFWFSLAGGRLLGRSANLEIPPFFLMFAGNIFFLVLGMFLVFRQKS